VFVILRRPTGANRSHSDAKDGTTIQTGDVCAGPQYCTVAGGTRSHRLMAAEGKSNDEIANLLSIGRHTVARCRVRVFWIWVWPGLATDAPRAGRTPTIDAREIVRKTTQEKPPKVPHWSTRSMARAVGVSEANVRVWRAHASKPHRSETFKISRDPKFAAKLEDIVGLYMNPPHTPSCSRWVRRVRSRLWIELNPACL